MSNGCCFFYLGLPWLPHKVSRDGWSYKLNSVFNVWQWLHCLNFTAATTGNNDSRVPGNQCQTLFETTLCKLTPPIHDCTGSYINRDTKSKHIMIHEEDEEERFKMCHWNIQFTVYYSNSYSSADNETNRPISWTKANCRSKWELIWMSDISLKL